MSEMLGQALSICLVYRKFDLGTRRFEVLGLT